MANYNYRRLRQDDRLITDASTGAIKGIGSDQSVSDAIFFDPAVAAPMIVTTLSASGASTLAAVSATTVAATGQVTAVGLATGNTAEVTTATYAQLAGDSDIFVNYAGTVTITLLNPVTYPGRYVTIRTYQAQLVNSATSNVSINGTVGASILGASAGKWASLKSDGTNWEMLTNN